jgi:hypothetical protein
VRRLVRTIVCPANDEAPARRDVREIRAGTAAAARPKKDRLAQDVLHRAAEDYDKLAEQNRPAEHTRAGRGTADAAGAERSRPFPTGRYVGAAAARGMARNGTT